MSVVRLGSRRSALASAQARWVAERLRPAGHDVEFVWVTTTGDESAAPLAGPGGLGGTGVFVSALRDALRDGRIDVAVHSLKDLPVDGTGPDTLSVPPGHGHHDRPLDAAALAGRVGSGPALAADDGSGPALVVAAVPSRQDPRDVVIARDGLTLGELPAGASVGTGSPRRAAQLGALGLGLQVVPVRGNVDTRVRRVQEGVLDAVVLARAGLARLGRLDEVTETLEPIQMLPAPGQGALGIECRADDATMLRALSDAGLDDPETRACVIAERAVLAGLHAGCTAPVGALADVVEGDTGPELWLRAVVATPDGADQVRQSACGPIDDPIELGRRVVWRLLDDGAAQLLSAASSPAASADSGPGPASTSDQASAASAWSPARDPSVQPATTPALSAASANPLEVRL